MGDLTPEGRFDAFLRVRHRLARGAVDNHRRVIFIAQEQAVVSGTGIVDDKPWRIGVADQIIEVDLAAFHQHLDQ